uniref:Uncharacterized protein n=1 Tax=Pyramimonas obovata TaxID=1411642 RepID=A0A7S0WQL1_9CHLO|mmetsp:Transcript_34869/g.76200  ORF Transcript_34869/g.76200 Transcript_34869/m.76200 type:complete len:414 (+) Transcript_34869:117-1358(+)
MAMQTTARASISVPCTAGPVSLPRRGTPSARSVMRREFAGKALLRSRAASRVGPARRMVTTTATATDPKVDAINVENLLWVESLAAEMEEVRENRRVVYGQPEWRKHRSGARYARNLQTFFVSGVLKGLLPATALCTLFAAGICGVNAYQAEMGEAALTVPMTPFSLSTSALSLLLVFRTNSSYDRWWEARKIWGGLLNRSRDFVRQGLSWFDEEDNSLKAQLVRYTVAFAYSLKVHLRSDTEDMEKALTPILKPEELEAALANVHVPNHILRVIAGIVRKANLDPIQTTQMDENITFFHDVLGKCERILKTPIPLSYTRHTSRFLFAWLLLLPIALYDKCGLLTIPAEVFVCLALMGIEDIGVQIEEPFSVLSCEAICGSVQANTTSVLDMQARDEGLIKPSVRSSKTIANV